MGAGRPKRTLDQEELYESLEDIVRDALLEGFSDDPILLLLIDVTTASLRDGLPIFANPLHEPVLYRKFRGWVTAGLEEAAKLKLAMEGDPFKALRSH